MEKEKILVWVCDDHEEVYGMVKERLETWSLKMKTELEIYYYESGKEMLQQAEDGECCDILIQDIDMPERNGIEIAAELQKMEKFDGKIIFLTSHEEYVFQSFQVNPFRYVRKEYMDLELEEAYQSAWNIVKKKKYCKPLVFKQKEETVIVKQQNILYFEYQKRRVFFYMMDGSVIKVRIGIKTVYEKCDKDKFAWINSGAVVNIEHIVELKSDRVILDSGEELFCSRTRKNALRQAVMICVGNQI